MDGIEASHNAWTISTDPNDPKGSFDFQSNRDLRFASWQLFGICDPRHPLCILADSIDWDDLISRVVKRLPNRSRWPSRNLRLVLGLVILSKNRGVDEDACLSLFIENIYWQYFCGMREVQWNCPVDRTTLQRWMFQVGDMDLPSLDIWNLAECTPTARARRIASASPQKKNRSRIDAFDAPRWKTEPLPDSDTLPDSIDETNLLDQLRQGNSGSN